MCRRASFLKAIYSLNFLSISRGFCHHYKVPDGACMLKKCAEPGGSAAGTAPPGGCFFELRNPSNQINITQPFRKHELYQIFLPSPPHFFIWSFADRIFTFPADSWCGGNLGSGINDYSVWRNVCLRMSPLSSQQKLTQRQFLYCEEKHILTGWLSCCKTGGGRIAVGLYDTCGGNQPCKWGLTFSDCTWAACPCTSTSPWFHNGRPSFGYPSQYILSSFPLATVLHCKSLIHSLSVGFLLSLLLHGRVISTLCCCLLRSVTGLRFLRLFGYELYFFQAFTWKSPSKVLFANLYSAVIHSPFRFAVPKNTGGQYVFCNIASVSAIRESTKPTDHFKTNRSRKHSAKGTARKNPLQNSFAYNPTACRLCQHLGLSNSPVIQESPEVSSGAVQGFSKEEYSLQGSWMGPCSDSDRCMALVVSLKDSRNYRGCAEYTHMSLMTWDIEEVWALPFAIITGCHIAIDRSLEKDNKECLQLYSHNCLRKWEMVIGNKKTPQLSHFTLEEKQPLHGTRLVRSSVPPVNSPLYLCFMNKLML